MRRLCLPDRSRGGAETTSAQRQRFLCGSQAWIKAASLIDARPVYGRRVQFRVLGTFEVDAGGARSPSVGPIKHAVLANLLKTRESARYRPRRLRRTHAEDRLQGRVSLYMLVVDLPLRTMTGPRRLLHSQVSGRAAVCGLSDPDGLRGVAAKGGSALLTRHDARRRGLR